MLPARRVLDHVPFPGAIRIELRAGILPPVNAIALVIFARDDVEIAVPIDIVVSASSLDRCWRRVDDVPGPPVPPPAEPRHGRGSPAGNHEIFDAVLIDV